MHSIPNLRVTGLLCVVLMVACSTRANIGSFGEEPSEHTPVAPRAIISDSETRYFLRLADAQLPPIHLSLDREGARALFGDVAAKEIDLMQVDSAAMLKNVLTLLQNACGTDWKRDHPPGDPPPRVPVDPRYACPHGSARDNFGADWQTSANFAIVRLLTMTPANAVVVGTPLQDLAQLIAENITPPPNFGQVLFSTLGLASRTSTFIDQDTLVRVLQRNLLGTHPQVQNPEGALKVTLHDALHDLAPLADKLSAVGPHPGVLLADDASFQTRSNALTPAFRMEVTAGSNLRWFSGVDLSRGGGSMFVSIAEAPLVFDFLDPDKFEVRGLEEHPTIDLRMAMRELGTWVPACDTSASPDCRSNTAQTPLGQETLWTVAPWFLEAIVGQAGYDAYRERRYSQCYISLSASCLVGVDIGQGADPAGWTAFKVSIDDVRKPNAQYIWELLGTIAQSALHDPNGDGTPDLQEGEVEGVFKLYGVDIGLTADAMVEMMRPTLQAQATKMAKIVAGKYWRQNDALDFTYRRGEDGASYLYFAAPSDLRPDPQDPETTKPYAYVNPGFFSAPTLDPATKLSSITLPGISDMEHEKLRLPGAGSVVYAQDDEGQVYELRFDTTGDTTSSHEITADVRLVTLVQP